MFTPGTTTKTSSHLTSVIANPTHALSKPNFAASPSSLRQLFNPFPLQRHPCAAAHNHIAQLHKDPPFQLHLISKSAPSRFFTKVAKRSSSGINRTLVLPFHPHIHPHNPSIHTSQCCPSPTGLVGVRFWMPSRGTHLPFHRRRKAGSMCSTRTKAKLW